jgi:YegS/Rv2252/BmrU family lipid kinase
LTNDRPVDAWPASYYHQPPLNETLFIVNPAAGRGTALQRWFDLRAQLARLEIKLAEHLTSRAGEATEVTRDAIIRGIARVVAVGGDGTLGEVVNGYLDESGRAVNPDATIGLLPNGTGSDFSRSLGFRSTRQALRALAVGSTRLIDAIHIVFTSAEGAQLSRFGINVASFGLGGETVAQVNNWRGSLPSWVGGRARFVAAAIRALSHYKNTPVSIELDQNRRITVESNLIVVANGRFAGGGMMFAPHAELDDGLLDVILTDGITRLGIIMELRRIGSGEHLKNPRVSETRAKEILVSTETPLAIEIDGEMSGYTPARLTLLPSTVRFAVAPT